jgi:transcriptional regulator with XRE-family HTH domain
VFGKPNTIPAFIIPIFTIPNNAFGKPTLTKQQLLISRKEVNMKFASILTLRLKEKGWTLNRLAKETKIPAATLHGWKTGRMGVNLEDLKEVATALEISVHSLVFGKPDPFESLGEEVLKEIFSGDVRITLHKIERRK